MERKQELLEEDQEDLLFASTPDLEDLDQEAEERSSKLEEADLTTIEEEADQLWLLEEELQCPLFALPIISAKVSAVPRIEWNLGNLVL